MADRWSGSLAVTEMGPPWSLNWERSAHYHAHGRKTKEWRDLAAKLAAEAEWPSGLARVTVLARPIYRSPSSFTDTGNCFPSVKAIVDGLVDYGLIPDDNWPHVAELRLLAPKTHLTDGIMVQVVEVDPVDGHADGRCGCRQARRRSASQSQQPRLPEIRAAKVRTYPKKGKRPPRR